MSDHKKGTGEERKKLKDFAQWQAGEEGEGQIMDEETLQEETLNSEERVGAAAEKAGKDPNPEEIPEKNGHVLDDVIAKLRAVDNRCQELEFLIALRNENKMLKAQNADLTRGAPPTTNAAVNTIGENPVEKVLCNDLILDNIFQYLKPLALKQVRLVCKQWNSVALSLPRAPFTLNINTLKMESLKAKEIRSIEKKLFRRIVGKYDYGKTVQSDLGPICKKAFAQQVQHITWTRQWPSWYLSIFPNLKSLSGTMVVEDLSMKRKRMGSFSTMEHLKTIDLNTSGEKHKELLQLVVNAAPNLEHIELKNGLVDFSTNTKLKSMILSNIINDHAELLSSLGQTQQLETLTLSNVRVFRGFDSSANAINRLLPRMPALRKLHINNCGGALFRKYVHKLGPEFLPNLEELSVSSLILKELAESRYSGQSFVHDNLSTLILKGMHTPTFLKGLDQHFPHLQRLEVTLSIKQRFHEDFFGYEENEDDYDQTKARLILEQFFESVKDLPIKHLKVRSLLYFQLQHFVNIMSEYYQDLFTGLGTFHFDIVSRTRMPREPCCSDCARSGALDHPFDNLTKLSQSGQKSFFRKVENILLYIKQVDGLNVHFRNFLFNAVTAQRIMRLIEDNKIAIRFTC